MHGRWRLFRHEAGRVAGPSPTVYVILFVACVLAGHWGVAHYGAAVLWPANGVLLAAYLQLHRRAAWRVLLVCFVLNLADNVLRGDTPVMLVANAVINVGEALMAGMITRRVCGAALDMRKPRRLARFTGLAVTPTCMVSALIGVTLMGKPMDQRVLELASWCTIEALGLLIVTPSLLLLARNHRFADVADACGGPWERAGLFGALVAVTVAVFSQNVAPVLFLVLPPLILISFRLSPAWAALSVILVGAISTGATLNGYGPLTLTRFGPHLGQRGDMAAVLCVLPVLHLFLGAVIAVALPTSTVLTERRRMEARLKAKTAAAVAARQAAEQALGVKSRFLSMMSHEMRTPLNAVSGFAEILDRRADLDAEARGHLAGVRNASERMLTLVEDILDFSRDELDLLDAPFDVAATAEEAVAATRPDAEAKGLDLHLSVEGDGNWRLGDARRVRQILRRLLSNSVKFTPAGRVVVAVVHDAAGVSFSVCDTGPGLSPALRAELFQPFAQADASLRRSHEGAGMGLALSRRVAAQMGGDITAENLAAGGAAFTVRLPLPVAEPPAPAVAAPATAPRDARAPRILVVDDHATNRQIAALLLSTAGCESGTACDGLEAVEAVRHGGYDLVLMDVRMPNMDGLEATRVIRALPASQAAIPIVAMTADAMPEDRERCRRAGMDDYLPKPISLASLCAVVERRLFDSPAADASVAA